MRLVASRRLWSGVAVGCALWLSAASSPAQPALPPPSAPDEWVYTVRPGDNLWNLCREYLTSVHDWRRLQRLNRLTDPHRIPPGTRLSIPFAWMKAQPAPARVVEARGEVRLSRPSSGEAPSVTAGVELRPGDVMTTGPDASVAVEFADGSRMLVGADARVVFDVLSAFGRTGMVDTRVRLERGRARSNVTPRRGRFRIWTPAAATVVRGTEFRAEFDAERRQARTEVLSGTVEATAARATIAIPPSFGTTAVEGAPPAPPVPLLPAPDLGASPRVVERLPMRIAVPPVAGAVAYHLELATDDRFVTLAYEGTSATAEFRAATLPDGAYALRLRAVDAAGLQGLDATSSLVLNARPEPPVLVEPVADAVVPAARPSFRWTRPADATGYRVQVAAAGATDAPLSDVRLDGHGPFTVDRDLQPGAYVWRAATVSGDEAGPFGDWQPFTRRLPPPGPQVAPPQAEAGRMRLAWPKGAEGSTYRLQVARDAAFTDLVVDETLTAPDFTLQQPGPGVYHLRVKTIEPDGFEGEFGVPQAFEVAAPPPPKRRFPWRRLLVPAVPVVILIVAS